MNNEVSQMEFDMPQLRQMVLENTERINRNELMINKMCMEAAEHTRKISELDEWLENLHRERDREMRISKERMDRLEKFAETSRIEYEKRSRELTEQIKETSAQMKETDRRIEESRRETDRRIEESRRETDRQIKKSREETDKQIKEMFAETNESIRRVSVEFLGVTGHIVEGLVSSSVEKIFKEAGFDLHNSGKNLKRELAPENKQMEVDVMLGNENIVIPVEVKEHFTKRKVKRFLRKMEMFREFFPEYTDKKVIAAVAAINYDAGADAFAHDEGLLVIRVSSDDIFSLDPVDENKLRKF